MTKGTLDAKPQVASAQQAVGRQTGGGDLEGKLTIQPRTARVRKPAKRTSRPEDKHGDDSHDAVPADKPGTETTVLEVRTVDADDPEAGKLRLTEESVERLREVDIPHDATDSTEWLADLDTSTPPAPASTSLTMKSYDFGYQSGYAAGEEDQKGKHIGLWQGAGVLVLGFMIGLLF